MPDRPRYPDHLFLSPEEFEKMEKVSLPHPDLRLTVRDALNPYREAFLAGGISPTDPVVQERQEAEPCQII